MSKPYYETEEYNEAENELDTYDDPVKLVMEYRISEKHKDNKIADLEAKLAKSEKERELDNSFWKQECDSLQKTLVEKDKEIEKLNACVKFYKSYYISFKGKVIDELEKVKRYIDDKAYYLEEENFGIEINEYIDNQINVLRNNKDGIH